MDYDYPWNIWIMDMDKYVKENFIQEVSSVLIYEPSTTILHPDGLYSERVFGEIGNSGARISTFGYVNLNCTVITPMIFLNILSVCPWYSDIMEGKIKVKFDDTELDFVALPEDDESGRTGYQFFIDNITKVKFKKNSSKARTNKIQVIEKAIASNSIFLSKMLVSPAGWRDIKVDAQGRTEVDEVNKLYTSLILASKDINPIIKTPLIVLMFDKIKFHVQSKVVEIFHHWKTFYEGKTGYAQEHYSKRRLADGTRNVISASTTDGKSPDDPAYLKHNETQVPLYQAAKAFEPCVIHSLRTLFSSPIYTEGSVSVTAIDPDTFNMVQVEVDPGTVTYALSGQSKKDYIASFSNPEVRFNPVTVKSADGKEYYEWLVYDEDDKIYIFRSKDGFIKMVSGTEGYLKKEKTPERKIAIRRHHVRNSGISALKKLLKEESYESLSKMGKFMTTKEAQGTGDEKRYDEYIAGDLNFTWIYTFDHSQEFYDSWRLISDLCDELTKIGKKDKWSVESNDGVITVYDDRSVDDTIKGTEGYISTGGEDSSVPQDGSEMPLTAFELDMSKVRPLTSIEMLYIATYAVTSGKFTFITRFPAVERGSIYPSHPVIATTAVDRVVTFKSQYTEGADIVLPHYPRLNSSKFVDAVSLHGSRLPGLNGDHDGDKVSVNGVMSTESIQETSDHLSSVANYVTPSGKFSQTISTMAVVYSVHALTRMRPSDEDRMKKFNSV